MLYDALLTDKKKHCTHVTYIYDDNIYLQDKYNFIIKQYEQSKNYIKELQTCNSQLFNEIDDNNNQIITLSFNLAKATFNIKDCITYHYNHSNIHEGGNSIDPPLMNDIIIQ